MKTRLLVAWYLIQEMMLYPLACALTLIFVAFGSREDIATALLSFVRDHAKHGEICGRMARLLSPAADIADRIRKDEVNR